MLNAAQEFVTKLLEGKIEGGGPLRYRAPHAQRGTPPRKHYNRAAGRELSEKLYREGLMKPQPRKYWNASTRY